MKIVIVIPSFNEAENIGLMIDKLDTVVPEIEQLYPCKVELLVVDGNSPDGTGKIVEDKSKTRTWVHLLTEEKKRGIGAAYFQGFEHAMHQLKADAVIEMDADFQHDPDDLKRLVKEFFNGADYVIGARFTKGGGIPKEWAFYRKLLSIGGNIFTKIVLGIYNVSDFTSGFKLSRVHGYLNKIDFNKVKTKSFAYKIDLLFKMHRLGAKIVQIPIKFGLRDRGNSKMESDNVVDSLKVVILLRAEQHKEFVKFGMVGGVGFAVDISLFNIFSLMITPGIAALVSGFFAMVTTFLLNNHWSFSSKQITGVIKQLKSFASYVFFSVIPIYFRGHLVSLSIIAFENNFWVRNVAFILGVGVGLVWNFLVYSKVIWRNKQ